MHDLLALMLLFLEQYVCMYVFVSFLMMKSDVCMSALKIENKDSQ